VTVLQPIIRVVLTGSECTGKTILARALALHYATVWVPEFSRIVAESKGAPLSEDDVAPIANAHLASEDEAARGARRILVLDTDLLSTVVYARHYYGSCPDWVARESIARTAQLYLLCGIDVPWSGDGVRDRGGERELMQSLFRQELEARGARFEILEGSIQQRLEAAVRAVDSLPRSHTKLVMSDE